MSNINKEVNPTNSNETSKNNSEINPEGVGCYPINEEEVTKHIQMMGYKGEFKINDPAELLAYAYSFLNKAEEYAYKWFWDRATDITDEEENDCRFNDPDGSKGKALEERVEANYQNILRYYNNKAIEILTKMGWRIEDGVNLWEEIYIKRDFR